MFFIRLTGANVRILSENLHILYKKKDTCYILADTTERLYMENMRCIKKGQDFSRPFNCVKVPKLKFHNLFASY
jgi:hypothetical protein